MGDELVAVAAVGFLVGSGATLGAVLAWGRRAPLDVSPEAQLRRVARNLPNTAGMTDSLSSSPARTVEELGLARSGQPGTRDMDD